jgi:hypothetical protein
MRRKSSGPRTPAGKARAALNAVTHGLRSVRVVTVEEKAADFEAVLGQLRREWQPGSVIEAALVEQIAELLWRRRRVSAVEASVLEATTKTGFFTGRTVECPRDVIATMKRDLSQADSTLLRVQLYQMRLDNGLRRALGELRRLHIDRRLRDEEPEDAADWSVVDEVGGSAVADGSEAQGAEPVVGPDTVALTESAGIAREAAPLGDEVKGSSDAAPAGDDTTAARDAAAVQDAVEASTGATGMAEDAAIANDAADTDPLKDSAGKVVAAIRTNEPTGAIETGSLSAVARPAIALSAPATPVANAVGAVATPDPVGTPGRRANRCVIARPVAAQPFVLTPEMRSEALSLLRVARMKRTNEPNREVNDVAAKRLERSVPGAAPHQ